MLYFCEITLFSNFMFDIILNLLCSIFLLPFHSAIMTTSLSAIKSKAMYNYLLIHVPEVPFEYKNASVVLSFKTFILLPAAISHPFSRPFTGTKFSAP